MKRMKTYLLPIAVLAVLGMIGCAAVGVDTTAPTVDSTVPANSTTGVAITVNITATFSEAMDEATITGTTFTLEQGSTAVAGSVSYSDTDFTATFNPTSDLAYSTEYTATITTGAKDSAGNPLAANEVWTFTTAAAADSTAPTVVSTAPADTATGIAITVNITATFSEAMNPATITDTTFTLEQGSTAVAGSVSYSDTNFTATFNPTSDLAYSTEYTATITTGAEDAAGNALAANEIWTFTTVSSGGLAAVNLGGAGNYAILAKSGITNNPTSVITGDVAVSPAALSDITGFSAVLQGTYATSTQVEGFIYAADMDSPTPTTLTTAVGDMEAAYTDAAGRSTPDELDLNAGEIGGLTLAPGLYKWGTDVTTSSDVTLNGGPSDVWIFQIDGTLSVAADQSVILSGGALPENIYWQVAGATVTLGAGAHFEGVVLAKFAITLETAATMNGRLLAQTAVNLDANNVTEPAP